MPWVDFAAVKQAVSLETVLGRYAVAVHRTHRHQLAGCCPIHGGQRADSFRVDLAKGVFHCFACQAAPSPPPHWSSPPARSRQHSSPPGERRT
jgi:DNA primase